MAAKIMMVGSVMMDLILQMKRAPGPSESVLGTTYGNAPGGKGSNAAVAAARLGADVSAYATLGKDANGEELIACWQREGINTDYAQLKEGAGTGLAVILLEEGGKNRIVIYTGANMETMPDALEKAFEQPVDALLLQLEIPLETNIKAVELAQKKGIITVLDAGPAQEYPLERLKGLTILSPNETETKALTGIFPDDIESCREASKKLMERNDCRYVVLKMGDRGSYIYGDGIDVLVPPYKVDALDPTAAGDAFTGALAMKFVETKDIVEAARYANAVGALSTLTLGAQPSLPKADAVERFIDSYK